MIDEKKHVSAGGYEQDELTVESLDVLIHAHMEVMKQNEFSASRLDFIYNGYKVRIELEVMEMPNEA